MAAHYQIGASALHTGRLLIAHPRMAASMFSQTVIFIADHSSHGAYGVVLNKPSRTAEVNDIIIRNGQEPQLHLEEPLYHGGPVQEAQIVMLHTSEWYSSNTRPVNEDFSVSSDAFMLEKMMMRNLPHFWRMFAGKSAWAPGQLENEIARGDWLTLDAKPGIVFTSGKQSMWNLCIELYTSETVDSFF